MPRSSIETFTRDKFINDLRQLVSLRTVNMDKETRNAEPFNQAMHFIQEQINPQAYIEVMGHEGTQILLASNSETMSPDICYLVHVDVVPAKESQFEMEIDGDMAYGRGVTDMKYSIPVGYALLNDLIQAGSDLSFMLAVTSDEESGGFSGAKYLADEYGLSPKLLVVPDGGDDFVLIDRAKGVCQLIVSAEGVPAHASRPWDGKSAVDPLILVAAELLRKYGSNNLKEGWHTTMNIGTITGGKKVNQVPGSAEMRLDFRFPPEQDTVERLTQVVTDTAKFIDANLKVEVTATGEHSFVDVNHQAIQLFLNVLTQNLKREIKIEGAHGSSDVRHFSKHGIPFIMTKPLGGDEHGDHEFIQISSVIQFYDILSQFLEVYRPNSRL